MYIKSLILFVPVLLQLSSGVSACRYLNLTTTAARNNQSTIECWRLANPFKVSTEKGTSGTQTVSLGGLANGSYSIVPAGTNDGAHVAPANQYVAPSARSLTTLSASRYVMFLSGKAEITVPNSTQRAIISAGKNGLFFAADTAAVSAVGHVTDFLKETVLIQIPVAGGLAPNHTMLYSGPCKGAELVQ